MKFLIVYNILKSLDISETAPVPFPPFWSLPFSSTPQFPLATALHCTEWSVQALVTPIQANWRKSCETRGNLWLHRCLIRRRDPAVAAGLSAQRLFIWPWIQLTVLHCMALHCTELFCTVLYFTVLNCVALHCTRLHCRALFWED